MDLDDEPFFEELYGQFCVAFPCYALLRPNGSGFVTEPASDGTASLVVLTDADLLERYRERRKGYRATPVTLVGPDDLAGLVLGLNRGVTHVTFDPSPKFHRRYPVTVLRKSLARTKR